MRKLIPLFFVSALVLGLSPSASAQSRTVTAAMGRPVMTNQASCFPNVWNGSVTDSCSGTVSYEIDLPTDNYNTKDVVLVADNSKATGHPTCGYCTYVPTSGFYQSAGQWMWGPHNGPTTAKLNSAAPGYGGISLPNLGLAYVTCNLTQKTQVFQVVYDP